MNFESIDVDQRMAYIGLILISLAIIALSAYIWGVPFYGEPETIEAVKKDVKKKVQKENGPDSQSADQGGSGANKEAEKASTSQNNNFLKRVSRGQDQGGSSSEQSGQEETEKQKLRQGLLKYIERAAKEDGGDTEQPNVTMRRGPAQDLLEQFDELNEKIALYKKRVELAELRKKLQDATGKEKTVKSKNKQKPVGGGAILLAIYTIGEQKRALVFFNKRKHTLQEGEQIGKATVQSIDSGAIVLEQKGRTRRLQPRTLPPSSGDEEG